MTVEAVPEAWGCHKLGYHHMVNTATPHHHSIHAPVEVWHWVETQLGSLSQGAWIDSGSYMCFQELSDAHWFDITWYSGS